MFSLCWVFLGKFLQTLHTWIWAVSLIFLAGPLKLIQIGWGTPVNCHLQVFPQMFYRIQVWVLAEPLKDIQRLVPEATPVLFWQTIAPVWGCALWSRLHQGPFCISLHSFFSAGATVLYHRGGFSQLMRSIWFLPGEAAKWVTFLSHQTKESFLLMLLESLSVCHMPFIQEWLLSIKAWLMEYFCDCCPSGRFFHLSRTDAYLQWSLGSCSPPRPRPFSPVTKFGWMTSCRIHPGGSKLLPFQWWCWLCSWEYLNN